MEQSVINGKLENLEDHKIGHRAPRPVGATSIPRRTHRLYFTLEEDQMLWDYMQPYEKARVSCVSGVRIYQVIAEKVIIEMKISVQILKIRQASYGIFF